MRAGSLNHTESPVGNSWNSRLLKHWKRMGLSREMWRCGKSYIFWLLHSYSWKRGSPKNSPHDQHMFFFRAHWQPPSPKTHPKIAIWSYQVIGFIWFYIRVYSTRFPYIIHVVFGWRILFKPIYFAFVV